MAGVRGGRLCGGVGGGEQVAHFLQQRRRGEQPFAVVGGQGGGMGRRGLHARTVHLAREVGEPVGDAVVAQPHGGLQREHFVGELAVLGRGIGGFARVCEGLADRALGRGDAGACQFELGFEELPAGVMEVAETVQRLTRGGNLAGHRQRADQGDQAQFLEPRGVEGGEAGARLAQPAAASPEPSDADRRPAGEHRAVQLRRPRDVRTPAAQLVGDLFRFGQIPGQVQRERVPVAEPE